MISDASNKVVATIPIGSTSSPYGLAFSVSLKQVYVALAGGNSVDVINDSTNKIIRGVNSLGTNPQGVAFDSRDSEVYVTNEVDGTVGVMNATASSFGDLAKITVGTHPYSDVFDPQNDEIFVTNLGANSVSVISG